MELPEIRLSICIGDDVDVPTFLNEECLHALQDVRFSALPLSDADTASVVDEGPCRMLLEIVSWKAPETLWLCDNSPLASVCKPLLDRPGAKRSPIQPGGLWFVLLVIDPDTFESTFLLNGNCALRSFLI